MSSFYQFLGVQSNLPLPQLEGVITKRREEILGGRTISEVSGPDRSRLAVIDSAAAVLLDPRKREAYDKALAPERPAAPKRPAPQVNHVAPLATSKPVAVSASTPVQKTLSSPARSTPGKCAVCSAALPAGTPFCRVCGSEAGRTPAGGSAATASPAGLHVAQAPEQPWLVKISRLIGYRHLRGVIVAAEAPYAAENEFVLWRFLLKIGIFLYIASSIYNWAMANPFAAFIGGAVILIIAIMASALVVGMILPIMAMIISLKGKEKQIMVRDVRLRDSAMNEHFVRFRGELRAGQAAVGDEISIWGRNRGGTLMARWGYNFRTKTRIWVRYR